MFGKKKKMIENLTRENNKYQIIIHKQKEQIHDLAAEWDRFENYGNENYLQGYTKACQDAILEIQTRSNLGKNQAIDILNVLMARQELMRGTDDEL